MLTSERFSDDQKKRLEEIKQDILTDNHTPEAQARRKEYIKLYPIDGGKDAYL